MTVTVSITSIPGFAEWRNEARKLLAAQVPPQDIAWNNEGDVQSNLFTDSLKLAAKGNIPNVPRKFMELAETAICHSNPKRFALLYKILWRLLFENKNLLYLTTDNDMMELQHMVKAVRHDAYKITAFLRFREIQHAGEEYFVAWYKPEHYTLERVTHFFQTRFKNMRWSILMPYRAAHWDLQNLHMEDNPNPDLYPREDKVEEYWLGYYANIFNPARPKKGAMLNQMPKKYWQNMPETKLIPNMLRTAHERTRDMIEKANRSK